MRLGHHHEKSQNFCLQFVHNFCGFEKVDEESKEIFSNLVTLSDKLELKLQQGDFTELAVQHEELTDQGIMESDTQRKDEDSKKK